MSIHRDLTIFQPLFFASDLKIFIQTVFCSAYWISSLRAATTLIGSNGAALMSSHAACGKACSAFNFSWHCFWQHCFLRSHTLSLLQCLQLSFPSNAPDLHLSLPRSSSSMCCSKTLFFSLQSSPFTSFSSSRTTSSTFSHFASSIELANFAELVIIDSSNFPCKLIL